MFDFGDELSDLSAWWQSVGRFSADFMHNNIFTGMLFVILSIHLSVPVLLLTNSLTHSFTHSVGSVVKSLSGFIVKVDQTCCNNPERVKQNILQKSE